MSVILTTGVVNTVKNNYKRVFAKRVKYYFTAENVQNPTLLVKSL